MSTFGGDSWAREAQYRKRRVDDLMLSSSFSSSSSSSSNINDGDNFKKLSNGKYACLVCPHNPVLDSPLAISMHAKGARHIAAVSRLKQREVSRQHEINKRIALSSDSVSASQSMPNEQAKGSKLQNQPLIEQTRKAILETQCNRSWDQVARVGSSKQKQNTTNLSHCSKSSISSNHALEPKNRNLCEDPLENREMNSMVISEATGKMLADWNDELCKRREQELKFTAAGWKRDGFGKWYKDENVEFDSDEDDPNDSHN